MISSDDADDEFGPVTLFVVVEPIVTLLVDVNIVTIVEEVASGEVLVLPDSFVAFVLLFVLLLLLLLVPPIAGGVIVLPTACESSVQDEPVHLQRAATA